MLHRTFTPTAAYLERRAAIKARAIAAREADRAAADRIRATLRGPVAAVLAAELGAEAIR